MNDRALTIKEFCERFRVSVFTFYGLVHTGKLRAHKMGRRTLVLPHDLEAYEASLPLATYRAGDRFGHQREREAKRERTQALRPTVTALEQQPDEATA